MKNAKLINSNISKIISELGHTDQICIADAGLPIPKNVKRIDIALKLGLPKFLDVLETIKSESFFEKAYFSKEILEYFPTLVNKVQKILGPKCKIEYLDHEKFKKMTNNSKAIVRTGENKWFHNVILQSGVTF